MFYFAWVSRGSLSFNSSYEREDEQVISFVIDHSEGEWPGASITIKNPYEGLLNGLRSRWAWLSMSEGSAGATPLFFGRLVGVPQDMQGETITLDFVARPSDWDEQREALADSLKVLPFYDPVFIPRESRNDPDKTLEGYTLLWHTDRVTHEVTTSDIIEGEAGTINIDNHFYNDFRVSWSTIPLRELRVTAEVAWEQRVRGILDMAPVLRDAASVAGSLSPAGDIQTYTGRGLAQDWLKTGTDIGGGWTVGQSFVERGEKKWVPVEEAQTITSDGIALNFPLWSFRPTLKLRYKAARQFKEVLSFSLIAQTQPLTVDPEDEDFEELRVSSTSVVEEIDGEGTAATAPLADRRQRSYFHSDRGHQSLEYLMNIARSRLLYRARAVTISFQTQIDEMFDISCRHNVSITDSRIPGGAAIGKVIAYSLIGDSSGKFLASVTIGCTIGTGDSVVVPAQTNSYVDGTFEPGVQAFSGGVGTQNGDTYYEEYSDIEILDDGIDFTSFDVDDAVENCELINGAADQLTLIEAGNLPYLNTVGWTATGGSPGGTVVGLPGYEPAFNEPGDVLDAVAEAYSKFCLELVNLETGPFETPFPIVVGELPVPQTIDLAA